MKRIILTDNFMLDEFIHPEIYKQFGAHSKNYLSERMVNLVQEIRKDWGKPIIINDWASGGSFIDSGLRDYLNPHKKDQGQDTTTGFALILKLLI